MPSAQLATLFFADGDMLDNLILQSSEIQKGFWIGRKDGIASGFRVSMIDSQGHVAKKPHAPYVRG